MSKKLFYLALVGMLMGLVGNVGAANVYWDDGAPADHLWSRSANWAGDALPLATDDAYFDANPALPTAELNSNATVTKLWVGNTMSGSLLINGGANLTTTSDMNIAYAAGSTGVVTIDGSNTLVTVGKGLKVGRYGNGTLVMMNGTLNVVGTLDIPSSTNNPSIGVGLLQLFGGTITAADLAMRTGTYPGTGTMDVTGGTLITTGNDTATIQGYITNGWITAYGGVGTLQLDYNIRNSGKTTLTAVEEEEEDTTAPTPDPMTWATWPYSTGSTSISMVATTASDPSGVEYYFDETSGNPGGSDSGWQDSPSYADTGLSPGTQYTYKVKARDKSTNHNETSYSTSMSATTSAGQGDTTAPRPDPMSWFIEPYATTSTSITMVATTASDINGVEYYFDETTGNPGGTDSGWQDSPSYTDTGLSASTSYTYRVIVRDKSANQNQTGYSSSKSETTSSGQDVTSGLVGRWNFDEGSGITTADSVGSANGLLQGTDVTWRNHGDNSYCLQSKNNSGVKILHSSSYSVSQGTWSCWVDHWWTESNYRSAILGKYRTFRIRAYRDHLDCSFTDTAGKTVDGTAYPRDEAFITTDGKWTHIAVSADSSSIKMYVNGQLVHTQPFTGKNLRQDTDAFYIAGDAGGDDGLVGCADDVRVYNRVLSDSEIKNIYTYKSSFYASSQVTVPSSQFIGSGRGYIERLPQSSDAVVYDAWLHYRPTSDPSVGNVFQLIIAEGSNVTVATAAKELGDALKVMLGSAVPTGSSLQASGNVVLGTPATSALVSAMQGQLGLDQVDVKEGFVIKSITYDGKLCLVVAGNSPAGVIFATWELIRKLQLEETITNLNVSRSPDIPIRLAQHWQYFRGFASDAWWMKPSSNIYGYEGDRENSPFSWNELKNGNREWAEKYIRLLSSCGYNAVCPTEVNWDRRDHFLEHLNEVKILGDICRKYGVKLYWVPNYIIAAQQSTADAIYAHVPDFGGYVLKLGSEEQDGDPRPAGVNPIARTLQPYGGMALVRTFLYGDRYRDNQGKEYPRGVATFAVIMPYDGDYEANVVIINKHVPVDFDIKGPIHAMDGAMQYTMQGTEFNSQKSQPLLFVKSFKTWLDTDNMWGGSGHYNKDHIECVMGLSWVTPVPSWVSCPINMANYYGMGRMCWDTGQSMDSILDEWSKRTLGANSTVQSATRNILNLSNRVGADLEYYRGYRGLWLEKDKTNQVMTGAEDNMVVSSSQIGNSEASQYLNQYSSGMQTIYGNATSGEDFLCHFFLKSYSYTLTSGRTIMQDIYWTLDRGHIGAQKMLSDWRTLSGLIDTTYYNVTDGAINNYSNVEEGADGWAEYKTCWQNTTGINQGTPGKATSPSPSSGATGVSTTADLSWTGNILANTHNVYFGTSSPGTFRGNQEGTAYDPGTLVSNTTYYWRIDEVSPKGTTTGDVWSFTTRLCAGLADFDCDGKVDMSDFSYMASVWSTNDPKADIAAPAGQVDVQDLLVLVQEWLSEIP
jgi:alpha-glucuronidase